MSVVVASGGFPVNVWWSCPTVCEKKCLSTCSLCMSSIQRDCRKQCLGGKRLVQRGYCSLLCELICFVCVLREQDTGGVSKAWLSFKLLDHLIPIHLRQIPLNQHQIWRARLWCGEPTHGVNTIAERADLIALAHQRHFNNFLNRGRVVNHPNKSTCGRR